MLKPSDPLLSLENDRVIKTGLTEWCQIVEGTEPNLHDFFAEHIIHVLINVSSCLSTDINKVRYIVEAFFQCQIHGLMALLACFMVIRSDRTNRHHFLAIGKHKSAAATVAKVFHRDRFLAWSFSLFSQYPQVITLWKITISQLLQLCRWYPDLLCIHM